jgi:hypothetical protein
MEMEETIQHLKVRIKKYKHQYEDKINEYKNKVLYLENKVQGADPVSDDLDKELEELAKLDGEIDGKEEDD